MIGTNAGTKNPTLYPTNVTAITTIIFKMYGIHKIGLYMIGIPNVTGSLIPNHPGTKAIFDTALICSDLAFNPNNTSGNVFPEPPHTPIHAYNVTG